MCSFSLSVKQDGMHSCIEVKNVFLERQVAGFTIFHYQRGPIGNCVSTPVQEPMAASQTLASAFRSTNTCTCLRVRKGSRNKEEEKMEEKEEAYICSIKTLRVYPTDPFIFIDAGMKPGTFHMLGECSTSQAWTQHLTGRFYVCALPLGDPRQVLY